MEENTIKIKFEDDKPVTIDECPNRPLENNPLYEKMINEEAGGNGFDKKLWKEIEPCDTDIRKLSLEERDNLPCGFGSVSMKDWLETQDRIEEANKLAGTCQTRNGTPAFLPRKAAKAIVPPIKCQGIKSKLVGFIAESICWDGKGKWIEPFLGSGVVLFSIRPERAVIADTNKHIVRIYSEIQSGTIDENVVRDHLEQAGKRLESEGEDYFYHVREEFNNSGSPLEFLFLSRSCFNGVMRFNKKGRFNVPFCRKPSRFRAALITKICNQVKKVREIIKGRDWEFRVSNWQATLESAESSDFVYCDPPYIGRHTDYFNSWNDEDATLLATATMKLPCGFAVSMWQENKYRANPHMTDWQGCTMREFSHFYHVGSTESLRNKMTEALIIKPGFAADKTLVAG